LEAQHGSVERIRIRIVVFRFEKTGCLSVWNTIIFDQFGSVDKLATVHNLGTTNLSDGEQKNMDYGIFKDKFPIKCTVLFNCRLSKCFLFHCNFNALIAIVGFWSCVTHTNRWLKLKLVFFNMQEHGHHGVRMTYPLTSPVRQVAEFILPCLYSFIFRSLHLSLH
jgi:hypothetical protein